MLQRKLSFYVVLIVLTLIASNFIYAINETVPPEMQKLSSKLIGKWNAVLTIKKDGKEITVKDMCDFTQIADGQGISMTENMSMDNGQMVKAVHLIGYDANTKIMHWYTVTSMGETIDNTVTWLDDNSFTIRSSGMMNGKSFEWSGKCQFVKDGYCDWNQTTTVNNAVVEETSGQFVRE